MPNLSLHDHPSEIHTIDFQDGNFERLINEVRHNLGRTDISGIVIFHDRTGLQQEFENLGKLLNFGPGTNEVFVDMCRKGRFSVDKGNKIDLNSLEQQYGRSLACYAQMVRRLTLSSCFKIVANETENFAPHLDSSLLTFVFAFAHAGTDIIATGLNEFERPVVMFGEDRWHWIDSQRPRPQVTWSLPPGTTVIAKGRYTGESHKPLAHNSPQRERPGDPRERLSLVYRTSELADPDLHATLML